MTETMGKIVIDDTCYPGEDLYCDGAVEDEILEIVKTQQPGAYGRVIEERKSWPILYHLSHLRENIISWIPVKKTDKVLEVGSGCGAITGALAEMAGSVTCVELSRKRSLINAHRHPSCENVTIKLGNFQELEPTLACDYDYIFLIGVFEYAQSYIGGKNPYETFMQIMKKHLSPGGRLVIAIESRLGLKYWAGCREDHTGAFFDGIANYPAGGGVRTFTRKALEDIVRASGITEYSFYYPYPDYKFMTCLYSDRRLPKVGELTDNIRNFDRSRLYLFDEKHAFDSLIREGLFPWFSNSYVLITGPRLPVVYARFSNDRAPKYSIRTEIRETESGMEVRKIPMDKEAFEHVKKLPESCRKLEEAYAGSGLKINACHMDGQEAVFEYLQGHTLEERLDDCLEREDREGFRALFDAYRRLVEYPRQTDVSNYDLIFSNLIITGQEWNLIDYEWCRKASAREIVARALYCYALGSKKRKQICVELMDELGYDEIRFNKTEVKEREFQKFTTGKRKSMTEIRKDLNHPLVPVEPLCGDYVRAQERNRIQIYEDMGEGFLEETSFFMLEGYRENEPLRLEIPDKPGRRALRLDPALDFCMVRVASLLIDGKPYSLNDKHIECNGRLLSGDTIVFATNDPGMTILLPGGVEMELEIIRITREMAESIGYKQSGEKHRKQKGLAWFGK